MAFGEKLLGLTTPVLLSLPVVTDARKFLQMGGWQSFVRLLLMLPYLPRVFLPKYSLTSIFFALLLCLGVNSASSQ